MVHNVHYNQTSTVTELLNLTHVVINVDILVDIDVCIDVDIYVDILATTSLLLRIIELVKDSCKMCYSPMSPDFALYIH